MIHPAAFQLTAYARVRLNPFCVYIRLTQRQSNSVPSPTSMIRLLMVQHLLSSAGAPQVTSTGPEWS